MNLKKYSIILAAPLLLGLAGCSDNDDDPVIVYSDPEATLDIVETAISDDRFEILVDAVTTANLVATLQSDGPFTVFAPTDEAFTNYLTEESITASDLLASPDLADILTYHVLAGEVLAAAAIDIANGTDNIQATVNGKSIALSLSGDDLYVNTSKVIVPDVRATNGVIHAIDKVLIPPADRPAAADIACGDPGALDNIATIANSNGSFSTLLTAVGAAEPSVGNALTSTGELTVFAPTDAAFAKIDGTALTNLLADQPALTAVLLNHVYSGAVDAVTAYSLNGVTVPALDGDLSISIDEDGLKVSGSLVTATDIYACNGIIHVIDTVIL